jgi:hypothetical protein
LSVLEKVVRVWGAVSVEDLPESLDGDDPQEVEREVAASTVLLMPSAEGDEPPELEDDVEA